MSSAEQKFSFNIRKKKLVEDSGWRERERERWTCVGWIQDTIYGIQ